MNDKTSNNLISEQESKLAGKDLPKQYKVLYPIGDKIALTLGIVLTTLTVTFFTWVMIDKLTQDWALQPVPATTPTPPLKPLVKS